MPAVTKTLIGIIITVIVLIFLQNCTYEKDALIISPDCPDALNVSYAASVRPLLQANCFSCHGNGSSLGDVSLETYDQVKQVAVSGRLLGAISHSQGFEPMPQGAARLSDCSIKTVEAWIEEGAQNN